MEGPEKLAVFGNAVDVQLLCQGDVLGVVGANVVLDRKPQCRFHIGLMLSTQEQGLGMLPNLFHFLQGRAASPRIGG